MESVGSRKGKKKKEVAGRKIGLGLQAQYLLPRYVVVTMVETTMPVVFRHSPKSIHTYMQEVTR